MNQVSSVLIRTLVEVAQSRGVSPNALLGHAASTYLSNPADTRIPLDEFQVLLARAAALTGDPALGLHCGLLASESSFGLMAPLVSHAPTLRHAVALVVQFRELISEQVRIELAERMGTAQLRCTLHATLDHKMVEMIVAGLVRMLRAFGCVKAEIQAVCFEHKRPAHYHAYADAFGGAERFAQPFTGIEFLACALDRPHMHWQPALQAVMLEQAERSMQQLSRPLTYTERVVALLVARREHSAPSMTWIARALRVSVRSLRRRLDEEGTSYRALIQTAQYESARSMLRNPELTLQAVAHELGFTDATSFHRAFVRWAGVTPADYREGSGASQR